MAKKVAVIMGGASFERAISIKSGQMIVEALEEAGYFALPLDADENLVSVLQAEKPNACYLALHGKGGEDGSVAALLEFLEIPYVGSKPEAARLTNYKPSLPFAMAQYTMDACWPEQLTLPESAFRTMGAAFALPNIAKRLGGYPLAVKPARGGSALGMTKVTREDQLGDAVMEALSYDDEVLFQKWIDGREISCVVLPDAERVFTPVEILANEGRVYDTTARLEPGYVTFAEPNSEVDCEMIKAVALRSAQAYETSGLVRVDMIWANKQAYLLDLKVSPGFTKTSLVLCALKYDGICVSEVVDELVRQVE